jgi:hypothetical protein
MSGYSIHLANGGWVEVPSFEFALDEALLIWRDKEAA